MVCAMEIQFYAQSSSLQPVKLFIGGLDDSTIAKVLRDIDLLEQYGSQLGMPHSKRIATNLYELRVRGKVEIRIFYTFHNDSAYLLHAFKKKNQKIPVKEIKLALERKRILISKS